MISSTSWGELSNTGQLIPLKLRLRESKMCVYKINMISRLFTATTQGIQAQIIEVEVDLSPSLPMMVVVGLADKAVQESKERIRSGIKQSGYEFPLGKITINLAPADIVKSGSSFDVPMAVGILRLSGEIIGNISEKSIFLGELALDGGVRKVNGVLTICLWAKHNGFTEVFVPTENLSEASLITGITIRPFSKLSELVLHLNNKCLITPIEPISISSLMESESHDADTLFPNDIAYVKGQAVAKRALEIAASGGHNVLLIGQPGSGKTLLARSYSTILPRLTEHEIIESTQLYSVAGLLKSGEIITKRPFRAPHHSSSHVALVGGGSKIRPGEISLAHRGVLFLDEFPEFGRETIEALRQPLEDGFVTISRASGSVEYPSRFYLIAAANPTPSGFDVDDPDGANIPQNRAAVARYQAKFSGPILDRIDLQVDVNRPTKDELQTMDLGEKSVDIAKRVQKARDIQTKRFEKENIVTNGEMSLRLVEKYCVLDEPCKKLMSQAIDKFKLSARSYVRILKLSRTIADLDDSENILLRHLAESLQYRGRWG